MTTLPAYVVDNMTVVQLVEMHNIFNPSRQISLKTCNTRAKLIARVEKVLAPLYSAELDRQLAAMTAPVVQAEAPLACSHDGEITAETFDPVIQGHATQQAEAARAEDRSAAAIMDAQATDEVAVVPAKTSGDQVTSALVDGKGRTHNIRTFCEELIRQSTPVLGYSEIVERVRVAFPSAGTTIACARWYASHMTKQGIVLPKRPRATK